MLEINNTTGYKLNISRLQKVADIFLRHYKKNKGEVSLAIVGSVRMRRLNYQYRGLDKPTDILSFPAGADAPDHYLGEIIINREEVAKVKKYQVMLRELDIASFKSRLAAQEYILFFLLVHGLLHLLGYDDKTESSRRQMLEMGRDFLKKVL